MAKTAKRLVWAKCINSGQTCIAPDYILCSKEVQDTFVREARDVIRCCPVGLLLVSLLTQAVVRRQTQEQLRPL